MSKQNNQKYNPSEKEFNSTNLNEIEDGEITNEILNTTNKVILILLINMNTKNNFKLLINFHYLECTKTITF